MYEKVRSDSLLVCFGGRLAAGDETRTKFSLTASYLLTYDEILSLAGNATGMAVDANS
jgi:hypothetical protein